MEAKELREQLKGTDEKYYEVTVTLQVDDETEEDKTYFFRKPKTPSYDRYLKTVQTSNSKALTAFCLDNIHPDQRETLEADFKEYPAMALSVGEKLLAMLGLQLLANRHCHGRVLLKVRLQLLPLVRMDVIQAECLQGLAV